MRPRGNAKFLETWLFKKKINYSRQNQIHFIVVNLNYVEIFDLTCTGSGVLNLHGEGKRHWELGKKD